MPFQSKAQQRYMFAKHPQIAKRWADHTADMVKLPERTPMKKTAAQMADEVLRKQALVHPFTETGDFRDATPDEWKKHQTERSSKLVKNLGTGAGALPGGAVGFLSALALKRGGKGRLAGAGLGALLGGAAGRSIFGNMNAQEAHNVSDAQWAKGLENYNTKWEKDHAEKKGMLGAPETPQLGNPDMTGGSQMAAVAAKSNSAQNATPKLNIPKPPEQSAGGTLGK